jgi:phage terminase small subunit
MNAQHKRFVENYLLSLNATKAAKESGYSEKTAGQIGYELLLRDDVKAAVTAGLKVRSAAAWRRRFQLLEDCQEIQRRCMQAEQVLDNEGRPTGEWKFDSKGALGAIQLEAKLRGLLKESKRKVDHSGEIKLTIRDYTKKNGKP